MAAYHGEPYPGCWSRQQQQQQTQEINRVLRHQAEEQSDHDALRYLGEPITPIFNEHDFMKEYVDMEMLRKEIASHFTMPSNLFPLSPATGDLHTKENDDTFMWNGAEWLSLNYENEQAREEPQVTYSSSDDEHHWVYPDNKDVTNAKFTTLTCSDLPIAGEIEADHYIMYDASEHANKLVPATEVFEDYNLMKRELIEARAEIARLKGTSTPELKLDPERAYDHAMKGIDLF